MGKIRLTEALSLEEDERQRRELQRAFGVSPEVGAPAQWHRATRDHWSLDAPSMVGGAGPSLHGVGGVAPQVVPRPAADTGHLRHLAQVFRDAAEEASTAALDGTQVSARSAAVAMALAATQGPPLVSAGARSPAPPGPGSGTSGGRPPAGEPDATGPTLTVPARHTARPTRSQSQRSAERRRPEEVSTRGTRRWR